MELTEAEFSEMQSRLETAEQTAEFLQESMADLQLALDDVGWLPMGAETEQVHALPLATIQRNSQLCRAMGVINPIIVRGLSVASAYVWGNGVKLEGIKNYDAFTKHHLNQKAILSVQAQSELEKCLGTDGNFFLKITPARTTRKGRVIGDSVATLQRVPLRQIGGAITDPDNDEDVWFYLHRWTTTVQTSTGVETRENQVYYPSITYDVANGKPISFNGIQVDMSKRIAHRMGPSQVGWKWGTPYLTSVINWAKAHKEFLETQAALLKAYSRFAWKATSTTAAGSKAVAVKVGTPASIDPLTGQVNDVGATAATAAGTTLQAVGRTSGSIDFKAGTPLAGYVAAGLSVPLAELLSDASEANRASSETLASSTLKIMKQRQQEHVLFFQRIFDFLGMDVKVTFPPIETELVYRQIQAIAQAAGLYVLGDKEVRELIITAMELDWDPDKVPTEEELKNLTLALTMAAEAKTPPESGASDYNDPSYGDNGYRNDMSQHTYTHGNNG